MLLSNAYFLLTIGNAHFSGRQQHLFKYEVYSMGNLGAMEASLRVVGRLPLLCGVPKANKHGWQRRRRPGVPRLFRESLFRPHSCHVNSSFLSPTQRNVVMLMPTGYHPVIPCMFITSIFVPCAVAPCDNVVPCTPFLSSFFRYC